MRSVKQLHAVRRAGGCADPVCARSRRRLGLIGRIGRRSSRRRLRCRQCSYSARREEHPTFKTKDRRTAFALAAAKGRRSRKTCGARDLRRPAAPDVALGGTLISISRTKKYRIASGIAQPNPRNERGHTGRVIAAPPPRITGVASIGSTVRTIRRSRPPGSVVVIDAVAEDGSSGIEIRAPFCLGVAMGHPECEISEATAGISGLHRSLRRVKNSAHSNGQRWGDASIRRCRVGTSGRGNSAEMRLLKGLKADPGVMTMQLRYFADRGRRPSECSPLLPFLLKTGQLERRRTSR